jgi:hypothetical protein
MCDIQKKRARKVAVHHTLTGGSTVTGTVSEAMGLWDKALWSSSIIPGKLKLW